MLPSAEVQHPNGSFQSVSKPASKGSASTTQHHVTPHNVWAHRTFSANYLQPKAMMFVHFWQCWFAGLGARKPQNCQKWQFLFKNKKSLEVQTNKSQSVSISCSWHHFFLTSHDCSLMHLDVCALLCKFQPNWPGFWYMFGISSRLIMSFTCQRRRNQWSSVFQPN